VGIEESWKRNAAGDREEGEGRRVEARTTSREMITNRLRR